MFDNPPFDYEAWRRSGVRFELPDYDDEEDRIFRDQRRARLRQENSHLPPPAKWKTRRPYLIVDNTRANVLDPRSHGKRERIRL